MSKVTKMTVPQEPGETKSMTVAVDVSYAIDTWYTGTVYIVITGIPADLPVEYEDTVIKTAKQQFASTLNNIQWLEIYPQGKSALDGETPTFINLRHAKQIEVCEVRKAV